MKNRTVRDYVLLVLKGLTMGAADVVPGVSGGTIAFITGIYNELLHSLKNIGPSAFVVLYKQGFAAFWQHVNGSFLLAVFAGILISIKTFASIISYSLEAYPLLVWGFFSGLIAASIILLAREQKGWGLSEWVFCFIGAAFVYIVSIASPPQLPGHWWVLFFGGFIAICAMILPGISGSFILLLLGLYPVFIEAVKNVDVVAIASFGAGCFCGLLAFSRFLSWLLDMHFRPTIAVLIGFLIGSLNVTWPWKHTLEVMVNRHGKEVPLLQENVFPAQFEQITGINAQLYAVILFVVFGAFLVLSTDFLAKRMSRN
ncbi:DUF368 domain-containing protein [Agarilytica rhodophyticola]|uniref:DUF368 domain-containing protein n=1 Tax=Agarilytica rhodophyticola TaxID=1737490 RepID=UPI001C1F7EFF|nr:DUF368 domain-containing protein [Agarilytica rhodophyticola]